MVVVRRRGQGRERRRVGQVVSVDDEGQRPHVEGRREEDDAIEADAEVPLQARNQKSAADAAVAFAEDVLRGVPTIVLGDESADELRHRVGVLVVAPEILTLLVTHGVAVAGADGIDEDEIGGAEDGVVVVAQLVGRAAGIGGVAGDVDDPRADQSEVQPDRSRARSAVVDEGDRPVLLPGHAILRVGDGEEAGRVLPVVILEKNLLGGGGVGDLRAAELRFMLCCRTNFAGSGGFSAALSPALSAAGLSCGLGSSARSGAMKRKRATRDAINSAVVLRITKYLVCCQN